MDHQWTPAHEQWLREQASHAGFDAAGIVSVDGSEEPATTALDAQRFADWIAQGRAGEMDYLKRRDANGTLLRSAVQVAVPWARSVVVCALNYNAAAPLSIDPAPLDTGWIARYAWSGQPDPANPDALLPTDYHNQLLTRLRSVESAIQQRFAAQDIETRCYVDTGPLVERTAAARAGIGWIGKNTCVINQQLGSWLLLGVVITSIPVGGDAVFSIAEDRCGSCTRCVDACPTDALVVPYQMDASRCIAYLTIEKKGSIPEDLRAPIGRQVFGCDICQDVCPWNRKSSSRNTTAQKNDDMLPRRQLVNPALDWLAGMDAAEFKHWFKGSPIERTRRKRLHRNVAIAMGNSHDPQFLPQLNSWATGEDPVLAEAATWAIAEIKGS